MARSIGLEPTREISVPFSGSIITARPIVGELHHQYCRM
jgi:hypothetical protein